jgi:hypothetical protein
MNITEAGQTQDEDLVMEDQLAVADNTKANEVIGVEDGDVIIVDTTQLAKGEQSQSSAEPLKANDDTSGPENQSTAPPSTTQAQEEVPVSAVSQDLNFDSMFDAPTGGTTDLDAADLEFLNDFNVDSVGDGSAGNTDLNSLLPGLESYANGTTDDFTMVFNPPGTNTNDAAAMNKPKQSIFDGMDMGNDLPVPGSNFDDLFLDGGDMGTMGDNDEFLNSASLGEIGDFDENLFDSLS